MRRRPILLTLLPLLTTLTLAASQEPSSPTPTATKPKTGGTLASAAASALDETGFVPLFDGKTLDGWTMVDKKGDGYGAKDGMIFCAKGGGGKLMTDREFSDFVLRFEFRMPPEGANNGIGIRAPLEGDAAYVGMEIQVLDEHAALSGKWGKLRDAQFHGSIYDVVPAKKGAMKPAGEWNKEEIVARGRQITVTLNGQTILDANLDDV
jgi:hypothetical protein